MKFFNAPIIGITTLGNIITWQRYRQKHAKTVVNLGKQNDCEEIDQLEENGEKGGGDVAPKFERAVKGHPARGAELPVCYHYLVKGQWTGKLNDAREFSRAVMRPYSYQLGRGYVDPSELNSHNIPTRTHKTLEVAGCEYFVWMNKSRLFSCKEGHLGRNSMSWLLKD